MKKLIVVGVICAVFCGVICSCSSSDSNTKNTSDNAAESKITTIESKDTTVKSETTTVATITTVESNEFTIDSTITFDDITMNFEQFNDITYDKYGFNKKDGYKILTIIATVQNNSDRDYSTSSMDCYADNSKCESAYISESNLPEVAGIDGVFTTVSAGREAKYYCSFYVPENAESIEIEMDKSFISFDNEKIIIKVK